MAKSGFRYKKFASTNIRDLEREVEAFVNDLIEDIGFSIHSFKSDQYVGTHGKIVHTVSLTYFLSKTEEI